MVFLGEFLITNSVTRQDKNWWKLSKLKIQMRQFWVIFKQCVAAAEIAELKLPCLIFQISKDSENPRLKKVWMQRAKTDEFRSSSQQQQLFHTLKNFAKTCKSWELKKFSFTWFSRTSNRVKSIHWYSGMSATNLVDSLVNRTSGA